MVVTASQWLILLVHLAMVLCIKRILEQINVINVHMVKQALMMKMVEIQSVLAFKTLDFIEENVLHVMEPDKLLIMIQKHAYAITDSLN